jgi:hypothetical protein
MVPKPRPWTGPEDSPEQGRPWLSWGPGEGNSQEGMVGHDADPRPTLWRVRARTATPWTNRALTMSTLMAQADNTVVSRCRSVAIVDTEHRVVVDDGPDVVE